MGVSVYDGLGLWPWRASYSLRCGVFLRQASYRKERSSKWGKRLSPKGSRLAEDAGGGRPWSCRACSASRCIDGVASSGFPAGVERRIKYRVTGAQARTDRSSLETSGLNTNGNRQLNGLRLCDREDRMLSPG